MDWNKIKNDYINGQISYAKLAEKYGVSLQAIKDRGTREKWVAQKKEQQTKIQQKTNQKTAEKLAEKEANRLIRIFDAADRLLAKIEEATEQLDQFIVSTKVKQKEVKYVRDKAGFGKPQKEIVKEVEDKRIVKAGHLDRFGLKQLTSALKDLRDVRFTANEEKTQETEKIVFVEDLKPDE